MMRKIKLNATNVVTVLTASLALNAVTIMFRMRQRNPKRKDIPVLDAEAKHINQLRLNFQTRPALNVKVYMSLALGSLQTRKNVLSAIQKI